VSSCTSDQTTSLQFGALSLIDSVLDELTVSLASNFLGFTEMASLGSDQADSHVPSLGSDQADSHDISMLYRVTGRFESLEATFWGQNGVFKDQQSGITGEKSEINSRGSTFDKAWCFRYSPDNSCFVSGYNVISAYQGQILILCLCDQESVKRISMQLR